MNNLCAKLGLHISNSKRDKQGHIECFKTPWSDKVKALVLKKSAMKSRRLEKQLLRHLGWHKQFYGGKIFDVPCACQYIAKKTI